jgi:hypothetical protein
MARPKITAERRLAIQDLAECVFEDHWGNLPVNPESIIEDCGITLSYCDYRDAFDGSLEYRKGRFHVYCNVPGTEQRGSPRVRFTLGHELGHYFIDEHRRALTSGHAPEHGSFIYDHHDNQAEQEADFFAASLLMPRSHFLKSVESTSPILQTILDISSTFNVSTQCAAIRCVEWAEWLCTIIMFRDGKTPWWLISPRLANSGYLFLRRLDSYQAAQGSATFDASQPGAHNWNVFHSTTTAAMWFSGVSQASRRNVILQEEAVRLGRHGVLTFLSFPDRDNHQPRQSL